MFETYRNVNVYYEMKNRDSFFHKTDSIDNVQIECIWIKYNEICDASIRF